MAFYKINRENKAKSPQFNFIKQFFARSGYFLSYDRTLKTNINAILIGILVVLGEFKRFKPRDSRKLSANASDLGN